VRSGRSWAHFDRLIVARTEVVAHSGHMEVVRSGDFVGMLGFARRHRCRQAEGLVSHSILGVLADSNSGSLHTVLLPAHRRIHRVKVGRNCSSWQVGQILGLDNHHTEVVEDMLAVHTLGAAVDRNLEWGIGCSPEEDCIVNRRRRRRVLTF